ncbi:MAG: ATP-binding cassette domain-containing protein [Firmicutes bacterium]|nr:ATP-binding cassette domain-containing protein [Bacillota bacterium]
MAELLLEVKDLRKYFPISGGVFRRAVGHVKAVDDISFDVYKGETLGIVGESGCGKTTTGRCVIRAIEATAGRVLYHDDEQVIDIFALDKEELRLMRKQMQMIFQDPYASLNPRMTVQEIVAEPLICYNIGTSKARQERVRELLQVVGLDPRYMQRYPHAFSGGQRQRIGIARALALNPTLVVADEAVSALDVSVQAQILNLLKELQEMFRLTYLFISHDLSVINHICDRIMVMYLGEIVELANTDTLFSNPKHPYVEALLSAIPRPNPRYTLNRKALRGEVGDPSNKPEGCVFNPRCLYATELCRTSKPELVNSGESGGNPHFVACHYAGELGLMGAG